MPHSVNTFLEGEAIRKWCPMINNYCRGSRCMMWTVVMEEFKNPERSPLAPPELVPTNRGYCKL